MKVKAFPIRYMKDQAYLDHSVALNVLTRKMLRTRLTHFALAFVLLQWTVLTIGEASAGIVMDESGLDPDPEPDVGGRDVCAPDQQLVLASFGSCGCCVQTDADPVSKKIKYSLSLRYYLSLWKVR
jgi:urea transporter